jgi:hypothetical protein
MAAPSSWLDARRTAQVRPRRRFMLRRRDEAKSVPERTVVRAKKDSERRRCDLAAC